MDSLHWKLFLAFCSSILLLTTAIPSMNIKKLRPSTFLRQPNSAAFKDRNNKVFSQQSRIINPFALFNWFGQSQNQKHKPSEDACHTDPCFDLPNTFCYASSTLQYQCVCEVGYVPAKKNNAEIVGCVDDPCKPNPCRGPHSFCYRTNATEFVCACKPGHSPIEYNSVANGCKEDPCMFKRSANITSITCRGCTFEGETTDDSACQNTFAQLSSNEGRINSPNYPDEYESDTCLEYVITADECSFIRATIYDFELDGDDDCLENAVEIREGNSIVSPVLLQLCGYDAHPIAMATADTLGNQMYVRFYASGSVYPGFEMGFEAIPKNGYYH